MIREVLQEPAMPLSCTHEHASRGVSLVCCDDVRGRLCVSMASPDNSSTSKHIIKPERAVQSKHCGRVIQTNTDGKASPPSEDDLT